MGASIVGKIRLSITKSEKSDMRAKIILASGEAVLL
jgi:hypothetical protein